VGGDKCQITRAVSACAATSRSVHGGVRFDCVNAAFQRASCSGTLVGLLAELAVQA